MNTSREIDRLRATAVRRYVARRYGPWILAAMIAALLII